MTAMMPARAARKFITSGKIKEVHLRFVAFGGSEGWVRVPKVEAKRMLRDLMPGSIVGLDLRDDGSAHIVGERPEPLVEVLRELLAANADFRAGLPADWEGDDLQDGFLKAKRILASIGRAA